MPKYHFADHKGHTQLPPRTVCLLSVQEEAETPLHNLLW